ncbi:Tubulin beta chain [Psidium guajava]|nr:Tubulin beta chain [Psidium guajava]
MKKTQKPSSPVQNRDNNQIYELIWFLSITRHSLPGVRMLFGELLALSIKVYLFIAISRH